MVWKNLSKAGRTVSIMMMLVGTAAASAQDAQTFGAQGPNEEVQLKAPRAPLSKMHGVQLPEQVQGIALPPQDNQGLMADDVLNDRMRPLRVSVGVPVGIDRGSITRVAANDGGTLLVLDVTSSGAYGVRLHLSSFALPAGVTMCVYDPAYPQGVMGPYSDTGPLSSGEFWAETTYGATARVEVYVPRGMELDQLPFDIDSLQHVYRDPESVILDPGPQPELLGCHLDARCYSTYDNIGSGVARMYFVDNGGGYVCTGQLLNTFASDWTPYFATANHCISTAAAANTLECYWNYRTASCNGAAPNIADSPRSTYATMINHSGTGDYCYLMIEGTIPRNLWWQGWNTYVPSGSEALVGVHHPGGSWQRISFGNQHNTVPACNGVTVNSTTHVAAQWQAGAIEGGSSGSGVYISNGQLVGVLSCGYSVCPTGERATYGKFGYLYNANAASFNGGWDDGYEDNDVCGSARYLGGVGYNYWGTCVAKSVDADWYRLTVPAGGRLDVAIDFTHGWGDVDMVLYDGCPGTFVAGSTGVGHSESLSYTNTGTTPRDYYLNVYLFNDTRNYYNLATNVIPPAPPASDACGNAVALNDGQTVTGTTIGATLDGSATCGASGSTPDIWYSYTAPCTGMLHLDTFGSALDTVISVHSGCPGNTGNQIACNDDNGAGGLWSLLNVPVTRFTTYYIRMSGYNGAQGAFSLSSALIAPANDACSAATPIGDGSYAFDTCGATTDGPGDATCQFFGDPQVWHDLWYSYTASCYGTAFATTCGANYDSKLAAYTACPGGGGRILACNDDSCGLQSNISFLVAPGQTYLVRVGGYNGARGSGNLGMSCSPDPCPADFNHDGIVDFFDYLDFVQAFSDESAAADFNRDYVIDFFDYLDFVQVFSRGC